MQDGIVINGKVLDRESEVAVCNTLKNVMEYGFNKQADKIHFSNPRIRIYYALDDELYVHMSALENEVLQCLDNTEDTIVMNISTFNRLREKVMQNVKMGRSF